MLDWHSCQICYPLEIKLLLLLHCYVEIISLYDGIKLGTWTVDRDNRCA